MTTKDQAKSHQPIIAVVGNGSVESAFRRYGAEVFGVRDSKDVKAAIRFADGIAFTGGGDVSPTRYSETKWHPQVYGVSGQRDQFEFDIADKAIARGVPLFGICRGLQLLNVAHGGTLHQDIDEFSHTMKHFGGHAHDVILVGGTRIHDALGENVIKGTSFHHQSVDRIAPNLQVAGFAEDGIVEMIESVPGVWPYVLGTQFHPEMDHSKHGKDWDCAGNIFKHFIDVTGEKAARRKPTTYRMSEAHKMRYPGASNGTTQGTSTRGTTFVTGAEWSKRKACSHGFKANCSNPTTECLFGDTGYIGSKARTPVIQKADDKHCEHGFAFHHGCKTTPMLPGYTPQQTGAAIERLATCKHGYVVHHACGFNATKTAENKVKPEELNTFDNEAFQRAVDMIKSLRDGDDTPIITPAIPRVGAVWDDTRECWRYDQSMIGAPTADEDALKREADEQEDLDEWLAFKERQKMMENIDDIILGDETEVCAFPPCMDTNACSPENGDCLHAAIAAGEEVSIASVTKINAEATTRRQSRRGRGR